MGHKRMVPLQLLVVVGCNIEMIMSDIPSNLTEMGRDDRCSDIKKTIKVMGSIPKIIHVAVFPEEYDICRTKNLMFTEGILKLASKNPGWKVYAYTENAVKEYVYANVPLMYHASLKDIHVAELSDLWRLIKLYRIGGIYADYDSPMNINLSTLIDNVTKIVLPVFAPNGIFRDFSQDLIITSPNNPILLNAYYKNIERRLMCYKQRRRDKIRVGPEKISCRNIYNFGPTTYMHAVSECLFGTQMVRGHSLVPKKLPTVIKHLNKMVKTIFEDPPFDRVLFNSHIEKTVYGIHTNTYNWKHNAKWILLAWKKKFYCEKRITNKDYNGRTYRCV